MPNKKIKQLLLKMISLFSVVRGYNIPIIIVAQYLAAIFILAPNQRAFDIITDSRLLIIVFVSTLTIASGYIINNFYDAQKDLINRPNKSILDRIVSQKTKLLVYFSLNILATLLALIISWRAALFFSCYIFIIWFYSHKLKRFPIIGNLTASLLAIFPFFGILLYYYYKLPFEEIASLKHNLAVTFSHAGFLYLLILIREMIKDLENIKGDLVNNYQTIPVRFGEATSKKVITTLIFLTIIPIYLLIENYDVGYMDIYFYSSLIVFVFFLIKLWKSKNRHDYLQLHNILKLIIVAGVFSIVLIEPSVLLNGRNLLLSN